MSGAVFLQEFSSHSLYSLESFFSETLYSNNFDPIPVALCSGVADDGLFTVTLNLQQVHSASHLSLHYLPGGSHTDETQCTMQNCGAAGVSVYQNLAFGGVPLVLEGRATVSCPPLQLYTETSFSDFQLLNPRLVYESILNTSNANVSGNSSLYTLTSAQQTLSEFRYDSWSTDLPNILSTTEFDTQNVSDPYAALQLTLFSTLSTDSSAPSGSQLSTISEARIQSRIFALSQDACETLAKQFSFYAATVDDNYFSYIRQSMYSELVYSVVNPISAPNPFEMPQFNSVTSLTTLTDLQPNDFGGCIWNPSVKRSRVGPRGQYTDKRKKVFYQLL